METLSTKPVNGQGETTISEKPVDPEIAKTQKFYGFRPHVLYRISPQVDNKACANRIVTFVEMIRKVPCDIVRAKVNLVNDDGTVGDEWLIRPSYIIPIR